MMKNILFILFALFPSLFIQAQTTFSCSYNGSYETLNAYSFENDELEDDAFDVPGLVNRILKAYNLPSSVITIIPSAQVNNALSTVKEGKPFILYSKYFVENMQNKTDGDWKLIGIFAHEVGHHILFHTMGNSSSRKDLELQADKWAGSALYKLGATKAQALTCVEECNENGSSTHPPRAERKLAVQSGWDEARQQGGVVPTPKVEDKPSSALEYTENAASTFIVMKKIPGGTFTMGSNDSEAGADETPHKVTVTGFYMAKTEVTLAQFKAFIDDTGTKTDAEKEGYSWKYTDKWEKMEGINWRHDCTGALRPSNEYNHPVIHVSWNDAVAYCEWLSRKSGKTYRLPTEAEWEYAAGNGSRHTKYSWGDGEPSGKNGGNVADESKRPSDGVGWSKKFIGYNDGYWYTAPVGSYNANDFGLQDMTGNVWEWCADYCNYTDGKTVTDTYYEGVKDPLCKTGSYRVLRGGCWYYNPQYCRVANRDYAAPTSRSYGVGFRLVSPQ